MQQFYYRLAERLSNLVGLKPRHLFPSPSKYFLLRKLVRCLNESTGMSIGIDVACADFKYRDLFKTDRYVGIDLDKNNLERGLKLHAKVSDIGVLANLLHLESTPLVADVVVSTHTIASLPKEKREDGVKLLAAAVMPNGTLFLNLPSGTDSADLDRYLRMRFGLVVRMVYGNQFFMRVENYFSYKTGSKNPLALATIGTASIVCYLLSYLEEIPLIRKGGAYTIYWCRNRKSDEIEARVSSLKCLSSIPSVEYGCSDTSS